VSYLTEVTVILTDWRQKHVFEDLVEKHEGFRPEPVETWGPNATGSYVYVLGLDYAKPELIDALTEDRWSGGTVVWIEDESWERPWIRVGGRAPEGGWSARPEVAR
jgi:hypothetical protein